MLKKIKRLVCYGDSLTWGYKPGTDHEQIDKDKRWMGILQKLLGNSYQIIEEGLNGRTLDSDDKRPGKEGRNGAESLKKILYSHKPIDICILMLGTNELKDSFNRDIEDISDILEEKYIKIIKNEDFAKQGNIPSILIISPPNIDLTKDYALERYSQLDNKLENMRDIYQEIAQKNNCAFLDSSVIVSPGKDGIHIDEYNHKKLGEAIYSKLKEFVNK
jgi:lysophospholipase L1-like esterase